MPRTGCRFTTDKHGFEVREVEQEGGNVVRFGGYALKWDDVANIRDFFFEFEEKFDRGAFKKTIRERGPDGNGAIKLLRQHNQQIAIAGKYDRLSEDETGLAYEAHTIDTTVGRDLAEELRSEVLHNMSINFDALVEEYDKEKNRYTVKEARLYEISPVLWGAYESSTVEARSVMEVPELLGRFHRAIEAGRELSAEEIGQLTQMRATIGQILNSQNSVPGEPHGGASVGGSQDHADLAAELDIIERELDLS